MDDNLLEIPRLFTSIAEVMACLIYILPQKKRYSGIEFYFFFTIWAGVIFLVQFISGELSIAFWIPGMLTAMACMYLYIRSLCVVSGYDAGFLFIRAFILAEFAAALEWQIYYYIIYLGAPNSWWLAVVVMIIIYVPIFLVVYFIDAKKVFSDRRLGISLKELINVLIIGMVTFMINNINFVVDNPFTIKTLRANLLYIRTLVDFCGLLILYAFGEQRREMYLHYELTAINDILHKHYDQYQSSRDSIELINRKHHDLKHQIAQIRKETDPQKREEYLEEIDHAMTVYESQYDTGNTVVDTILSGKSLYCNEHNINLSCVVDGRLVDFMMVMDICSIFGNALDNCIESVLKIANPKERIIRVAVFSRNEFLMMRFENYYEEDIEFSDGLPITTKTDRKYHGYGIKSIKKTIEAYKGNIAISTNNNWFVMKILIPLPGEEKSE